MLSFGPSLCWRACGGGSGGGVQGNHTRANNRVQWHQLAGCAFGVPAIRADDNAAATQQRRVERERVCMSPRGAQERPRLHGALTFARGGVCGCQYRGDEHERTAHHGATGDGLGEEQERPERGKGRLQR